MSPADAAAPESVVCDDVLPLSWEPLGNALHGAERDRLESANLHLLRALAALEQRRAEPSDKGSDPDVAIALLHDKINLVVELLAGLVQQAHALPPAQPVQLSRLSVSWRLSAAAAPADGAAVRVSLYLNPSLARALTLTGVAAIEGDTVTVRFDPPGEGVAAELERHVFRQHRRAVADARRSSNAVH